MPSGGRILPGDPHDATRDRRMEEMGLRMFETWSQCPERDAPATF